VEVREVGEAENGQSHPYVKVRGRGRDLFCEALIYRGHWETG